MKEAAKLAAKRHYLVIERNLAEKQAEQHWECIKRYGASGRIEEGLE